MASTIKLKACYACGTTSFKEDKEGYLQRIHNRDEDKNMLCKSCAASILYYVKHRNHQKYIEDYKKHNTDPALKEYKSKIARTTQLRRLKYKGNQILFDKPLRKGVCSNCNMECKTHLCHLKYHDEDPLRDTIELCISCHRKLDWILKLVRRYFPKVYSNPKFIQSWLNTGDFGFNDQ